MKKTFDCVEMKRKAQEIISQRLAGMSDEEKLKYWQEQDREFKKKLEAKKRTQPA